MGWWQVNADTLAGSRFVLSPLAEAVASLIALERLAAAHPGERTWLDTHRPAYRERLASDPVTALLVRAALGRHWIADFLTPAPTGEDEPTFGAEVAGIRETSPESARADLAVSLGGSLPSGLHRSDLPERAAGLLEWVWTETVLPYWPRRRRIMEADVVARTRELSQGGWAAALAGMRPGMRWLGEGRLQINAHDYPPRKIAGAQLLFVPVTPRQGWVSWDEPHRYAVIYPCSGMLAQRDPPPAAGALEALLGSARAGVLVLLDTPKSTTQLVALTGQGLGSVGRHLKVLLDARLVERRRVGRSVLYYRTAVGEALLEALRIALTEDFPAQKGATSYPHLYRALIRVTRCIRCNLSHRYPVATVRESSQLYPGSACCVWCNRAWGAHAGDDLLVILGEEVTTQTGHWLALGIKPGQLVDWRYRVRDEMVGRHLDQVHHAGGLCVAAHPHAPYPSGAFMYPYLGFDVVEVWNGLWTSQRPWNADNEAALAEWDRGLAADVPGGRWRPAMGNSDTHLEDQIGIPQTVVLAKELSAAAVLDGIRGGRSWIAESAAVQLSLKVAAGDRTAGIGERLETCGEPAVVLAEVRGVPSGAVSFHTDRGAVHRASLPGSGSGAVEWRTGAEESRFVRVEVRHPGGPMAALSNPILLG